MKLRVCFLKLFAVILIVLFFCGCGDLVVTDKSGLIKTTDLGVNIGIQWTNQKSTNMTRSISGNWDSLTISDPVVIKKDSTYYMFYSGKGPDDFNSESKRKWRIGYATSTDGINWVRSHKNPIINPSDFDLSNDSHIDTEGVRVCSVLYDSIEKTFKMWLRGFRANSKNSNFYVCSLMYASATDIDKWYKYPANSDDEQVVPVSVLNLNTNANNDSLGCLTSYYQVGDKYQEIGKLSVFKEEYYVNTVPKYLYVMWVSRNSNENSDISNYYAPVITSAYSYNETGFILNKLDTLGKYDYISTQSTLFYNKGYVMPAIIKDYYNGKLVYKMWFMNNPNYKDETPVYNLGYSIGFTDGEVFSMMNYVNGVPKAIIEKGVQSDESDVNGISNPWVIRDEDKYKMWYVGKDADQIARICYMESLPNY
jgi:hypothetical protein